MIKLINKLQFYMHPTLARKVFQKHRNRLKSTNSSVSSDDEINKDLETETPNEQNSNNKMIMLAKSKFLNMTQKKNAKIGDKDLKTLTKRLSDNPLIAKSRLPEKSSAPKKPKKNKFFENLKVSKETEKEIDDYNKEFHKMFKGFIF